MPSATVRNNELFNGWFTKYIMFKILVLTMLVLTAAGYSMQVFASSGLGVFFDNRSSDNKHLSFVDSNDSQDLTLTRDNITVEAENSNSNTLGNKSEESPSNSNSTNMTQDIGSS